MAILPEIENIVEDAEITIQTSHTYKLDLYNKRVVGNIDGSDALVQAVIKRLNTEQYAYPIYGDYGTSLESLIGKERDYVKSVIEPRIRESLLQDDRIRDIDNFEIKQETDKLIISFDVHSYDGFFSVESEVVV